MTINGPAPIILALFFNAVIDQAVEAHLAAIGQLERVMHDLAERGDLPKYQGALPAGHDGRGLDPAEYVANGRDSLLTRVRHRTQECDPRFDNRLPLTRRFVTNVSVSFAHCRNEYDVVSYLQVTRIGHEGTTDSEWSAERRNRLRGTDRAFAISHREVLIDSIHPGASGLAAFL
jgi:hypothetical protein